ncbi:ATP-binding region ATPase domain protein [Desulfurispirillum indicum S5]|uniref:ATP-binding region ATPase domain protein n=1 Tax=Desulfurispirillum indicum (strain ATCC BAA-1389 / DSM 22839 / S5) TaxID=653733 RepID=E6W2S6_DESIS|nr:ATP-binding protein [Desulfurispirillum indicum]ADU65660.1 ATP-binding region ATPase domain protein [Desulfurispirillum indicum S5]
MTTTMVFASDLDEVATYAKHIVERIPDGYFTPKKLYRVRLAVDEAMTNAIMHGNKSDTTKSVQVNLHCNSHGINISITDEGDGFDQRAVPQPTADENLLRTGGRGIYIVAHYADSLTYNDKGNQVTLAFARDIP